DLKSVSLAVLGAIFAVRFHFGARLTIYRIVGFNPEYTRHAGSESHRTSFQHPTLLQTVSHGLFHHLFSCRYPHLIHRRLHLRLRRGAILHRLYIKDMSLQDALGMQRSPAGLSKPTRNTAGRWVSHCGMTRRVMIGAWKASR
ncbi:uncharacterized protein B0I36DRAFT_402142, partial [Microdochium trichocladiopsis]